MLPEVCHQARYIFVGVGRGVLLWSCSVALVPDAIHAHQTCLSRCLERYMEACTYLPPRRAIRTADWFLFIVNIVSKTYISRLSKERVERQT